MAEAGKTVSMTQEQFDAALAKAADMAAAKALEGIQA